MRRSLHSIVRESSTARLSLAALPIAAGLVLSASAQADVIVTYDPTGINGSGPTSLSTTAATSMGAAVNAAYSSDVTATSLTAGGTQMTAVTAGGASNNAQMYNGLVNSVNNALGTGGAAATDSLANDVTNGASYYTFTLSPLQPLNISAIDLSGNFYTSSNTGYPTFVLESSLTGFGSTTGASGNVLAQFSVERDTFVTGPAINTTYGATVMTPYQGANTYTLSGDSDVSSIHTGVTISPTDVVNISGLSAFNDVTSPVEFRLYVYTVGNGANGIGGKYFGIGGSGSGDATSTDNAIVVDGTLAGAPEPASAAIVVGGAVMLALRRRRFMRAL